MWVYAVFRIGGHSHAWQWLRAHHYVCMDRALTMGDLYTAMRDAGPGTLNLETVGTLLLVGAVGFGSVAVATVAAVFIVIGAQRDSG